eukprot:TRINITY_DN12115_c0_g1_i1.p1 TRINITY_DN12115_c0_g1~~TRINITY_DN12115_c0_g1_i1.p1  ORF type:complete len:516 (+),score=144.45 TRINITY_DN12115_c0_g1_i1:85-1632(+)
MRANAGDGPDYYARLGLSSKAKPDEVRQAYRKLARNHHPDRAGVRGEEMFKKIGEAYAVLSDPAKKREYDCFSRPRVPLEPRTSAQTPFVATCADGEERVLDAAGASGLRRGDVVHIDGVGTGVVAGTFDDDVWWWPVGRDHAELALPWTQHSGIARCTWRVVGHVPSRSARVPPRSPHAGGGGAETARASASSTTTSRPRASQQRRAHGAIEQRAAALKRAGSRWGMGSRPQTPTPRPTPAAATAPADQQPAAGDAAPQRPRARAGSPQPAQTSAQPRSPTPARRTNTHSGRCGTASHPSPVARLRGRGPHGVGSAGFRTRSASAAARATPTPTPTPTPAEGRPVAAPKPVPVPANEVPPLRTGTAAAKDGGPPSSRDAPLKPGVSGLRSARARAPSRSSLSRGRQDGRRASASVPHRPQLDGAPEPPPPPLPPRPSAPEAATARVSGEFSSTDSLGYCSGARTPVAAPDPVEQRRSVVVVRGRQRRSDSTGGSSSRRLFKNASPPPILSGVYR